MTTRQVYLDPSARADEPSLDKEREDGTLQIATDLAYRRLMIVNVVFYGLPGTSQWVLVDTGMFGTKRLIESAANDRFGPSSRPSAIILTHGHFDHVGCLEDLAREWDVPVYAHPLEHPYLNGREAYPAADPSVGGGMIALSSSLFPRAPVNVGERLKSLPENGTVPHMPGWRWIATPGHSRGHISLWREDDRAMIVGDAFVTTRQESVYAAITQEPEMHGPPMYYTPDWASARQSVRRLARLQPELIVTGHGRAMRGPQMRSALDRLATDFDQIAVPKHGRYIESARGA